MKSNFGMITEQEYKDAQKIINDYHEQENHKRTKAILIAEPEIKALLKEHGYEYFQLTPLPVFHGNFNMKYRYWVHLNDEKGYDLFDEDFWDER